MKVIPIVPAPAADTGSRWLYEKHRRIHPRAVSGRFARWRWVFVWLTQLLFYGLPWLAWNDRPMVLFDLEARRFYLGALVLHPQDFIYLTWLLVLSACALFFFTTVAGRLWCGFACPQTVYTELFQWIERRFEGDRMARLRLEAAPWTWNKVWRTAGKQSAWLVLALWTGITFVGYFTPVRELLGGFAAGSTGPWEAFWVLFYGAATYGNAGHLREQVCLYMCPYARFQSAMFDRDTLIVSYDSRRGDPRGTRGRKDDAARLGLGSCIDCGLCVQVCPTGIDIRDGLQYQCIGCAACVDVCDGVMDKMHYPRGLIRFATQNGLAQRSAPALTLRRLLRPRVLAYGALLLALGGGLVAALALRAPLKVDVVRDRGVLAREVEDGRVENVYRLQVMNGTESRQRVRVSAEGLEGAAVTSADTAELAPAEARWLPVRVQVPPATAAALGPGAHALRLNVTRVGGDAPSTASEATTFVVPR